MRRLITVFVAAIVAFQVPCFAQTDSLSHEIAGLKGNDGAITEEAVASEPEADSVSHAQPSPRHDACYFEQFRLAPTIKGSAIFTVGAAVTASKWYRNKIEIPVRDYFQENLKIHTKTQVDDICQFAPTATYLFLGYGIKSSHSFTERFMAATTSTAIMTATVCAMKYTIRRMRPDDSRANSFPSGHTATAFMGAELILIEYGPWWGAGAYVFAAGVGICRMYNNRHWMSDVIAGAGVGILSAHAAYWLLPAERKLFGMEHSSVSLAIVPSPYGFSLAMNF